MISSKKLPSARKKEFLSVLQTRFEKNMQRHKDIAWKTVLAKLEANDAKIWSLHELETTGGEPDVISQYENSKYILFIDCAAESPALRRSLCYDKAGQESRKEFKPENNAIDIAASMGVDLLTEEQYRHLQHFGKFDTKTSSWLKTPDEIRKLGGAIFADFRYGRVFIYHNGAQSYYAARGFRALLKV